MGYYIEDWAIARRERPLQSWQQMRQIGSDISCRRKLKVLPFWNFRASLLNTQFLNFNNSRATVDNRVVEQTGFSDPELVFFFLHFSSLCSPWWSVKHEIFRIFSDPRIFWKKNEKWVRFFIFGAQINRKIDFTIESFLGGILRSIVKSIFPT